MRDVLFIVLQKFSAVRKEDSGQYYCRAKNEAGVAECNPQMMEVCKLLLCLTSQCTPLSSCHNYIISSVNHVHNLLFTIIIFSYWHYF